MTCSSKRVVLAVTAMLIVGSAPVSADVAADDFIEENGFVDAVVSFAKGLSDRARNFLDRSEWDPDDAASDVKVFYNRHNSSFESYVNNRTSPDTDSDVIKLEFKSEDKSATVYLVADVNGTQYENSSIVDTTSRETDEWVTLCGPAAKNAPEEIEQLYDEFVSKDKDVTKAYTRRLAGEYGGHVKSSFIGHREECDA